MKLPKAYFRGHGVTLYLGDSLELLDAIKPGFDALVTDPPYSSGGLHAVDRRVSSGTKYLTPGKSKYHGADFSGDNRDQRSQLAWLNLWLSRARLLLNPSAYAMLFSDWRQIPLTTDAVQCAGLTWRGVIAWDKGNASRAPHNGYFRHQCEFVTWATVGRSSKTEHGGPWPGCLRHSVNPRLKNHPTSKPVAMMAELMGPVTPGGTVLDPFAGGGGTLAACVRTGRKAVGVELDERWCEAAANRVVEEAKAGAG